MSEEKRPHPPAPSPKGRGGERGAFSPPLPLGEGAGGWGLRTTRRRFLRTATTVALGAAVGCGSRGGAGKRELRVFVYSGGHEKTMREVFVPVFEQATGVAVTLFPGWWDGIPKLKTAPANDPPFDLMITDATQGYPAAREGLFAQINLANVPNHKALVPAALEPWVFQERVGLPYPDSVMTLAYHKQAAGAPPARWADLLRPDLAGKIGLYNHFYMSLFTFAAVLADSTGQAGAAHDLIRDKIDDVFRFAVEHRKRVKLWWPDSTAMILGLNDRTVAAGNMHSPEYLQALREKPELAAAVPDRDRAMVQVFWAVPAGTKNTDLAEQALDLLFSDRIQLEFARRGMATARSDTAAKMAAEDPLWKSLYPHTDEQFRTLKYYPYDVYASHWDQLADRWDRTVLRG
jgi:putative spermidine/putrescine transport system substrate-binding protein